MVTKYSQGSLPVAGCRISPSTRNADVAATWRFAASESKRRWCRQPGQILRLSRIVALQCGQVRVLPGTTGREATFMRYRIPWSWLVGACLAPQPNSTWPRIREPAATVREPALTSPLMTPPRAARPAWRSRCCRELAADDDDARLDLAFQVGAGIEGDVAVDLHVALETTGDAHVAGADDLALDGEIGGDDRFFHIQARRGRYSRRRRPARHVRAERRYVRAFRLPCRGGLLGTPGPGDAEGIPGFVSFQSAMRWPPNN